MKKEECDPDYNSTPWGKFFENKFFGLTKEFGRIYTENVELTRGTNQISIKYLTLSLHNPTVCVYQYVKHTHTYKIKIQFCLQELCGDDDEFSFGHYLNCIYYVQFGELEMHFHVLWLEIVIQFDFSIAVFLLRNCNKSKFMALRVKMGIP